MTLEIDSLLQEKLFCPLQLFQASLLFVKFIHNYASTIIESW